MQRWSAYIAAQVQPPSSHPVPCTLPLDCPVVLSGDLLRESGATRPGRHRYPVVGVAVEVLVVPAVKRGRVGRLVELQLLVQSREGEARETVDLWVGICEFNTIWGIGG